MSNETRLNTFKEVNRMAQQGGIVFLGSDYFASLPVNELAMIFNINEAIFNRKLYQYRDTRPPSIAFAEPDLALSH